MIYSIENLILSFLLTMLTSFLFTKLIYIYYKEQDFTDIPDGRNLHDTPTVTGGGITIVVLNIFGIIYYDFSAILIIPLIIISILGFLDDKISLSPLIRIIFHFVCSCFIIIWIEGFPILDFNFFIIDNIYIRNTFGIIFISWFINLYNFMDGSDGFAILESIFISLSLFFLYVFYISLSEDLSIGTTYFYYVNSHPILAMLVINISACMGFLFLNYPNAKIFMGDQGSGFLGLYLISYSLYLVNSMDTMISVWTILILYGIFFIDSTITLLRRFMMGKKWYRPHRSHFYQRFIIYQQKNISRKRAHGTLLIWSSLINYLWLFPIAFLSVIYTEFSFLLFLLSSIPLIYLSIWKYNQEFEV